MKSRIAKKKEKIKEQKKSSRLNIKWKLIIPWLYRKRGSVNKQVDIWMETINWD